MPRYKTRLNPPLFSKINWTSFLQQLIGIVILWEVVPVEYADKVAGSALLVGGLLNMIFRTFYTNNVENVEPTEIEPYEEHINDGAD